MCKKSQSNPRSKGRYNGEIPMRYLHGDAQHIGSRRYQQDSLGSSHGADQAFQAHGGFLAVVCEGMGGMEHGDIASQTAVRTSMRTPATLPRKVFRGRSSVAFGVVAALVVVICLARLAGCLLAARVAALHLCSAAALFEVAGGFFLGLVADFDVVRHALGTRRFRHSRGGALVLHHARGALPICDAALHTDRESVLADFRLRQLDANGALDGFVFLR